VRERANNALPSHRPLHVGNPAWNAEFAAADIGHFVNEKVQTIPGILDTRTIITFKAF